MTNQATQHATFTIRRHLKASPARVFAAWANPELKAKWFSGAKDQSTELDRKHDFRVGGQDHLKTAWKNSFTSVFDAVYHDIVPDQRIIYSYAMHLDDVKISVSLATIELKPKDNGTELIITEHGVFLNGYDDNGAREHGTNGLVDKLEQSLQE